MVLQVTGSGIRDDREWRDSWGSDNPAVTVFRFQILRANKHFFDGSYDYYFYSTNHLHLLPSVGWDVLWPIL